VESAHPCVPGGAGTALIRLPVIALATVGYLPSHPRPFDLAAVIGFKQPFLTAVIARPQRERGAHRLGPRFLWFT